MTRIVVPTAFCLLVFSGIADAQTYGTVPNIMTPEAATLGKFGAYPVSYYTGGINVTVPLYTIKENDLSLDLGLSNSASGFVPNEEDGIVGLNWNLMAGGVITRQVNWAPDDQNKANDGTYSFNTNLGYIYGMLQAHPGTTYTKDYLTNLQFLFYTPGLEQSQIPFEYSPDVFTFNFNGHSGRFFLGNDGTVKVSADHNYKVDLTGMSGQSDLCQLNSSTIVIRTDEGDIYTFGGDFQALQITYPSGDGRALSCPDGIINAWYLTSIQTHNGRTITFNYESQARGDLTSGGVTSGVPSPSIDWLYEKAYYNQIEGETSNLGCGEVSISNAGHGPSYSLIKTVYLQSIVTPTTEIDFSYSQKAQEFYGSGILVDHNKTSQLDKIQIKDADGNSIKNITMEYTAYGSSTVGYRNFLHKVNFQDPYQNTISSYQFDYWNTPALPSPLTRGIDLWGYYNGHDENITLIPTSNSGPPNYDVTFTGREAEPVYSITGLLKTVTYPTGGSSQLAYQGHDYSKVLRRTVAGGLTPQWFTQSGNAGGVRIQSITNSDGITRSFFYKQNYDPNNANWANLPSSGILTDHDIFLLDARWQSANGCGYVDNSVIQDNNIATSASYSEPAIGYSEVTELVAGGGYSKYFYSTQETNPDVYNLGLNTVLVAPSTDVSTTNYFGQMERLIKFSSCDLERGKLLKTQIYKNENNVSTLLREIDNTYNTDPSRFDQSVIGFNWPHATGPFAIYHSYALYYFQDNITSQTTKEYANGSLLSSTINNTYISNSNPLVRTQSKIDSKGDTKTVNYTYPGDLSTTDPYRTMVGKNMISSIVQQDTYKNSVNLLTSTKTNYNFWTGTAWDITNTTGLILPQSVQTKTLNQSSYDSRFNYDTYNTQGDVTSFSKPNDVEHCYVWGYHKLYPIAEVMNATPAQVAYTSFEDADFGGWTPGLGYTIISGNGFTGKKTFSGTISKDVPLGNYVVTMWSSTAATSHTVNGASGTAGPVRGGWQLYTYAINNSSHIAVAVDNCDELRLYPVGAQMTTYTFDLLVGMTSRTDVNNRTTYFQYDPIGRLFTVKDQDGNILKKYCYNYAGQPEVCNFYLSAGIDADYLSGSCDPQTQYALPYHVTVPQGKFGSYVDQPTADAQAQQYAQSLANQNGTCAISDVSVYYDDEVGGEWSIQLHNVASQEDYWIDVSGHSDGTIDVPPGTYNITFTDLNGTGYFNFTAGCGYSDAGPTMTFSYVSISASCNTIVID